MAIIKCPECGHQISEKAKICPICGVEIAGNIAKCSYCGEVFFKDAGLCPHCYRPLKNEMEPLKQNDDVDDVLVSSDDTSTDEEVVPPSIEDVDEHLIQEEATDSVEEHPENLDVEKKEVDEKDDKPNVEEETDQSNNDVTFVDTDGEDLQRPEHIADDNENEGGYGKHRYMPIFVSLAITALIAAVCLYFYNDSKISREVQAFELAMNSGDVSQMNGFLRNFAYATDEHKKAIIDKIADITKQKEDLSLGMANRDRDKLLQYLKDYPDTPQRLTILGVIDSLDWEDALKTNTKKAFDNYIEAHADGIFIKEAKARVAVKVTNGNAEDAAMAKSLYREFFLSVNGNQPERLAATLNSSISSFVGTSNAKSSDVVGWMKRQHKEDVSSVIWKLNHDYKITKREMFEKKECVVEFSAQKTVIYKDGHSNTEHFKIKSNVSENKKIASMDIVKLAAPKNNSTASVSKISTPQTSSSSTPKIKKE